MKFEGFPFNKDHYLLADVKTLVKRHGIKTVVETGTYKGDTAAALATFVPAVVSIESQERFLRVALTRVAKFRNVVLQQGDSPTVLRNILSILVGPILFYLDAHWGKYCPLLDELDAIARAGIKPYIVIHDFFVPNCQDLGFDSYNGQRYDYEWIKPKLDQIGQHKVLYNSSKRSSGARRGVIFLNFLEG